MSLFLQKKADFKQDTYPWRETSPYTQSPFRPETELPTSSQEHTFILLPVWPTRSLSISFWINSFKKREQGKVPQNIL